MICTHCGEVLPDNSKFCRRCGAPISVVPHCPHCGASLPEQARFCRSCGVPVIHTPAAQPSVSASSPAASAAPPSKSPKRSKSPRHKRGTGSFWQELIIALAAILMLLAIVTGALYATDNLYPVLNALSVPSGGGTPSEGAVSADTAPALKSEPAAEPENATVASSSSEGSSDALDFADTLQPEDTKSVPPVALSPLPADPEEYIEDSEFTPQYTDEEIEEILLSIREKYNRIMSGISLNSYRTLSPVQGVTYYLSNGMLVAVTVQKNVEGSEYARSYYYSGNTCFFAYFEGEDAYRLYLQDNCLVRLRYTPSTTDNTAYVDYNQSDDAEFLQWQTLVSGEAHYFYLNSMTVQAAADAEYLLPESDSRYLTADDLLGFSADQCRLARNEIYARHGRRFHDDVLQRYFDAHSWYQGSIEPEDFSDSVFNEYERFNTQFIWEYEAACGYR